MSRRFLLTVAGLTASSSAFGFCGLYVAEEGKTISNHGSEVIWAHYDGTTTITIGADAAGNAASFGLLVPVPQGLGEDDVDVIDHTAFDELDQYTTPRMVSYTCDDFRSGGHRDGDSIGCAKEYALDDGQSGNEESEQSDDAVQVEARFTEGEYEFAILATSDADALNGWLATNGFAAPVDRDGILQGYIDNGTHFLAARVALANVPPDKVWLSPIQFSYSSDNFWLPIRIGTLASDGTQEVVIYGITDADDGELHIANFDEVTLDDECMPRLDGQPLDSYYRAAVDAAFDGRAGWLKEYSIAVIGQAQCDPCTSESPLFLSDLPRYGWHDDAVNIDTGGLTGGGAHLTRLRVRYTPEQAVQDLRFEMEPTAEMSQIRYIQYLRELEDRFPVCGEGMVADPGSCDAGAMTDGGNGAVACGTTPLSGFASAGALSRGLLAAVGLTLLARRRRA